MSIFSADLWPNVLKCAKKGCISLSTCFSGTLFFLPATACTGVAAGGWVKVCSWEIYEIPSFGEGEVLTISVMTWIFFPRPGEESQEKTRSVPHFDASLCDTRIGNPNLGLDVPLIGQGTKCIHGDV